MVRRLPPLKALRVFEAAARHANFTAAAEELSITHSAISQQIRLLEDYIGQPLFTREARGVTLMPHARDYFTEVQASLDRIASATTSLKSPNQRRCLRVCTTPSLAMKWLIPRLAGFQTQVPDVDVQLSTVSRQFFEHAEAGSDVLIRRMPLQRPDYSCVRCLDDYLVPVASPRFIERHRIYAVADCLAHPLLQAASGMDNWPRWFELAGVQVPSQLPGPVFDHQFLCLQAAMNDLGLALAPWCLLEEDIRADRLRPLFARPRLPGPGIYALYRNESPVSGLARQFIDWLGRQGHAATGTET
ncbi:LysR family transcriptional regulator, glycine cleavage system transcriptional activator [Polaromonas sp. OV174]|uniref:LysR substrate-binding domain-containing protein n=1 Tax=Polaromonas sp. OV174 TaxID=1855300 RepID=UPI0008E0CDB5|nr:LysR substrate-binding domain-containing protein [Polaromonas sp. OV174]SFC43211.1 LysR family transcriptional regulator, glycine cleavage system transcriptional activator [Polaromonas sp. OV174]